jgi:anti-anti-sigma factor
VPLTISTRAAGDVTIVDLSGRATIDGESELLTSHLKELASNSVRKLLLNLAGLTQVDSSGVSVIVASYVSLKRQGGELKLFSARGRVLEVLTVFRLGDVIPCFDDEAAALASFQQRGYSATS